MNRILAFCAAVALLPMSGACRADEVFPVAHKEPIAIWILDGRSGTAQAGVSVLLTGGYDRRDLAVGQWHEELVTDADGKVQLSDALRNLPLLSVEVLKRHGCGPAMAALSVERIRMDGMSAPNLCGAARIVDSSGVLTVFVKGKKATVLDVTAIPLSAVSNHNSRLGAAALTSAQPVGASASSSLPGMPAEAPAKRTSADTPKPEPAREPAHAATDGNEYEPEGAPPPELAPIPFLEPISDFAVPAAPARTAADAAKPAPGPADKPGGKPSAAHAAATAAGTPLAEQPVARLKRASQSSEGAVALRRGNFSHSGYSAEDRAAEAHARGLALAAARAAGQLMGSAAVDSSARTPHTGLAKSKPSAVHHGIVSPGSATAPAPLPTRSAGTAEDAGDTECVPVG